MNRFYVETSEGKISYLKKDGKPFIILLHGMGGMGNNFLKIASCIKSNYGLIFPDLLGHGKSYIPRDISVGIQADAIQELIENLGIDEYYIGGNSYGGWVSLYHEYKYGGSKGLILISSAGTNPTVSEYGGENEDQFIMRIMKMNPGNNEMAIRNMLRNNGKGDFKITDDMLRKINKRTLIIWGEKDRMIPVQYGDILHNGIANSEMHLIKDGGHTTHVSHPDEVCSLINNFL
ncbi:alpha/beta fold hydrolase [Cuniculiplasma sp. SKW4]|uniref:alpha/beta fold hydrolase n=1 Tax=Cuniculiplasma sp. SKW4 TaxID=3400171 RepID=UPI003FD06C94